MPAPSKSFTNFPDSDLDPESPITTAVMIGLRDNDVHNYEWIGYGYMPAQAHSHDGVDSTFLQANVAANLFNYQQFI